MKVGLVCPYSIFRGGGVQEVVLALQTELSKQGHTAYVITPLPRDRQGHKSDGTIFIGTLADIKSPFHTTAQVSVSLNTDEIDSMLLREKFDVLHFHEPWVPIMSRQLLSRSQAKNIATFHAKLPETVMSRTTERVITPYTKSVIKYLDAFTAVSDAAAEYIQSLTKEPIRIIPNGINLAKYKWNSDGSQGKKSQTILFIGRLEKRKGVKYLLKAFAHLLAANPSTKLVIAGDGPDREKLQALASDLQLKNVRFAGFVTETEKLRLIGQADLFCSPALYGESFGIVLLEAMASGLVAVAGNNPGYVSVLQGKGALSIVNPKDSVEFARRLDLMLHDEGVRAVWRKWARQYAKQFSYQAVTKQYEELYKAVVSQK